MADEEEFDAGVVVGQLPTVTVPRHIKKRSLRNKALSVGFSDKDLRDFVTGFHKRKKKRRKEAQRQLQEKERSRRIQARKQRKQERELALYGGASLEDQQGSGPGPGELGGDHEEDELDINASVSGMKMFENNETTITVTTTELSRDNDDLTAMRSIPKPSYRDEKSHSLLVKKKPLKQDAKRKKPAFQKKYRRNIRNKR